MTTEPSGCDILKPSRAVIDVKPSMSCSQDELTVPHVEVTAAAVELSAAAASTDDTDRANSPHSLSAELTGYSV